MDLEQKLKVGGFLIALIGVPMFFYREYLSDRRDMMRYTLTVVDRLRSGDIFDAKLRMLRKWDNIPIAVIAAFDPSEAVLSKLTIDMMEADLQFRDDFVVMVNYYDTISICVTSGQCDSEIVGAALSTEAAAFFRTYEGAVIHFRNRNLVDSFGRGLEELAR